MLTERQRMILTAIVDDYIRSAEPVGSRSISKRGEVGFSPATIRNEMSDLEELGFLEQPHTSAGRIPSHRGYRYYVDHLVKFGEIDEEDLNLMKSFFAEKISAMEQLIQHAAAILSNMTKYTSIVLGPEVFDTSLRHFQLLPLSEHTAVAIIVTNTGHVENKTLTLPAGVSASELEKIANILNHRLTGVPLYKLKSKLINEVGREMRKYVSHYEELIDVVEQALEGGGDHRVFLSGATNMLNQPEFRDVDKVKTILDLLEETPTITKIISSVPDGIQVRIGTENNHQAFNNCSLITATYTVEGKTMGTIGILGPTRMEYGKVLGLLNYLSKDLTIVLERWFK
ncbi:MULTISPECIES: heat-inducible transcriptional repressor HrcA [unclassified Paenibacillus]|uniref:heat-inducible transcriptional repressor HrcA n=1 Tax=unclassified Paenibacillus TaxID=185978 RepID=UPI001C115510|nr:MULTISPECIES: heat-inducible transcriptional repressor HrcA [unclassified Paenibacillus]MBU5440434.1 heat-inducible transcriptional repressor HrcA [Paenibacillus sp. MSJ-34]CAH0119644.1 Heat-inducible transcription repressor HrcA [Paenibacillus sp. CECT 9249]